MARKLIEGNFMIKLICGCDVEDYEGTIDIKMKETSICMFEGIVPSVSYFKVCNLCYEERYSKYPDLILTEEDEINWLTKEIS